MHIERSIEIHAPRELVWQLVHDPASRAEWDVRVARLTIEGEQAPGAQATIVWRTPVAKCVSEAEVTCFDVPRRSAMAIDEASLAIFPPGERSFAFEETRKGTRVTTRYEIDTDAEHRAPGVLVRMLINRDIKQSLKNLRRLALDQVAEYAATTPRRGAIAEGS